MITASVMKELIPPENVGKPEVFLTFSGSTEIEHWLEMA